MVLAVVWWSMCGDPAKVARTCRGPSARFTYNAAMGPRSSAWATTPGLARARRAVRGSGWCRCWARWEGKACADRFQLQCLDQHVREGQAVAAGFVSRGPSACCLLQCHSGSAPNRAQRHGSTRLVCTRVCPLSVFVELVSCGISRYSVAGHPPSCLRVWVVVRPLVFPAIVFTSHASVFVQF